MPKDSRAYIPKLNELGKYWGHIQGYGPLIDQYMKLLTDSVNFRVKYPFLPGTLKSEKINLEEKVGADHVDAKFEFVLDILDLLENLLLFQKQIFRTFDRAGSSSTHSGQNRLTPCVPVIMDTQELYSMCVKFLLILHNELPSEPLAGFRSRFLKLYDELKAFYSQCVTIHFLRQIVSIPKMPTSPPDFHSTVPDINEHHKTLQQATVVETRPPSPEMEIESLIDISNDLESLNVTEFQESSQLDQLRRQVEQLNYELSEAKREQVVEATKLLEHITKIENEKGNMGIEIEGLRLQQESKTKNAIELTSMEEQVKAAEIRSNNVENAYKQLKDKHLKLVNAHANLLRSASNEKDTIKNELFTKMNEKEAQLEQLKSYILQSVVENSSSLIQKKKSQIGIESVEQRIHDMKSQSDNLQSLTHDQTNFPVQLALLATQLSDIAGKWFSGLLLVSLRF